MSQVTQRDLNATEAELKSLAKNLETRALTEEEQGRVTELKNKYEQLTEQRKQERWLEEHAAKESKPVDKAGKSFEQRCKDFSIAKIIASKENKNIDAGMEQEVSDELQLRSGQYAVQGATMIPWEALAPELETRATLASPSQLWTDDYRPQLIDVLRNSLIAGRLGCTMLRGLTTDVKYPKKTAVSGAGQWLGETASATEGSAMTFANITLSAKKFITLASWSATAAREAMPSINQLVRRDLMDSVSREIDRVVFYGTGTGNDPIGLKNQTGISAATQTGTSTNGKALVLADIFKLASTISAANVSGSRTGFATNYKVKYALAQQKYLPSSTDSKTIYANGMVAEMPVQFSNMILSNGTKGTGTGLSELYYSGAWEDLLCATFGGGIQLLENPYSGFAAGNVQLRAMVFVDIAIRRTESFAYYNDVVAS